MKERKIKILTAVMTASVVGLIALQLYWINNLIKIEEERFERSAHNALVRTAFNLERQEAARTVVRKISDGEEEIEFIQNDSLPRWNRRIPRPGLLRFIQFDSTDNHNYQYLAKYLDDSISEKNKIRVFARQNLMPRQKPGVFFRNGNKIIRDSVFITRDQLVRNIVTELTTVHERKKIEERVSVKQINRQLEKEFKNNGIFTDFYFGIDKSGSDSLVLTKEGADINELRKSNMRTLLFPGEMFRDPNQLVVYFPNKKTYLLGSASLMLAFSITLIVLISTVFYSTLQMFIRQKKLTEIKNDLINNITHEFKTPISTISIACEVLNEPEILKGKDSLNKYTSIIIEENERLKLMVDNLLNAAVFDNSHSQSKDNSYPLNKQKIDLDDVITEASEKFKETINKKNGNIIISGIPSQRGILVDKFHIVSILGNIIDNAIKYNEYPPEILIDVTTGNTQAVIKIKDNGIGITKENISKIFETFYRVPTGNIHNVRGNGIGLSYARNIIEAHGGNISVTSSPGKGSTFELRIPLLKEQ